MKTTNRSRWKPFTLLASVFGVSLLGICLLIGKARERREYVGRIDPLGYRCRFTLSAAWQHDDRDLGIRSSPIMDSGSFVLPPSPIQHWINLHLLHQTPVLSGIGLSHGPIRSFNGSIQILGAYPELAYDGISRILSHRHLSIDGFPATVVRMERPTSSGEPARATNLIVYVAGDSLVYIVGGGAEASNMNPIDHEMQAIIASLHIEKVGTPSGKQ